MDTAPMSARLCRMEITHYIFVDFENKQGVDLRLVAGKPVRVLIVVGTKSKVPLELVKQLMEHSAQVRLIETQVKGKNALDFVLAWEAGLQSAADPKGSFHIVSGDKGFDAMIEHMRFCGLEAARHESFASVPPLEGSTAPAPAP